MVFFSLPFAFIALEPESGFRVIVWVGIGVWAIGNVGTIAADRQLAIWRADPSTTGMTREVASGAGHGTRTTSSSG